MTLKDLTFRQIAGERHSVNSLFIHPSGMQAIVVNGIPNTDDDVAEKECYEWLQASADPDTLFDHEVLFNDLHQWLQSMELQATAAMVSQVGKTFEISWVGNYTAAEVTETYRRPNQLVAQTDVPQTVLGVGSMPRVTHKKRSSTGNNGFILYGQGLDRERLSRVSMSLSQIRQGDIGEELSRYATNDSWSAIVFPIGTIADLSDPNWPYDPFIGKQEPRTWERSGLRKIATALFGAKDFEGFRILEGPHVQGPGPYSSRTIDALLICPYGVFLLSLKDHLSPVEIHLGRDQRQSMVVKGRGRSRDRMETNPVIVLREAIRPFASEIRPIVERVLGRGANLHCTGMVVFTNDNADVMIVERNGAQNRLPYRDGDVTILRPTSLPRVIRRDSARGGSRLAGRHMRGLASGLFDVPGSAEAQQPVSDFSIDFEKKLELESTDYFNVYQADQSGDRVWAKEFKLSSLGALTKQDEFSQIAREVRVVQQLNRRRTPGVQFMYGQEESADALYIFVEPAHQMTLEGWIDSRPSREDRLAMLVKLADIVGHLSDLPDPVIHRAINPRNIRISGEGDPQLINFELCQRTTIMTLPVNARRTFDEQYQPPEVSEHGRQLTPATDVFSYMLCAYFTLCGRLPFENSIAELQTASARPRYWRSQMAELGLPSSEGELWRGALHPNVRYRPTIEEVEKAVQTWE